MVVRLYGTFIDVKWTIRFLSFGMNEAFCSDLTDTTQLCEKNGMNIFLFLFIFIRFGVSSDEQSSKDGHCFWQAAYFRIKPHNRLWSRSKHQHYCWMLKFWRIINLNTLIYDKLFHHCYNMRNHIDFVRRFTLQKLNQKTFV